MAGIRTRQDRRRGRHQRIRKRISGTGERPRMAIMVSNKHMYVQFIDDTARSTLAAVSTLNNGDAGATVPKAKVLGERAAEAARAAGIGTVVVDRGGFAYHGRVRALVEAVSGGGLEIGIKPAKSAEKKSTEKQSAAKKSAGKKPAEKGSAEKESTDKESGE